MQIPPKIKRRLFLMSFSDIIKNLIVVRFTAPDFTVHQKKAPFFMSYKMCARIMLIYI